MLSATETLDLDLPRDQAVPRAECEGVLAAVQSLCEKIRSELGLPLSVWLSYPQCLLRYGGVSLIVNLEEGGGSDPEGGILLSACAFDGHHFVEDGGRMTAVSSSAPIRRLEFRPQSDASGRILWVEEGASAPGRTPEEASHLIVKMALQLAPEAGQTSFAAL